MRKYVVAMVVICLSASVYAQRVVSGLGSGNPMGLTKASACEGAKSDARQKVRMGRNEVVVGYSRCECEANGPDKELPWRCTVDAYVEKKKE